MTTHSICRLQFTLALLALLSAGCQGKLGNEDAEDTSDEVTDVLPDSPVDVPVDQDLMDPVSDAPFLMIARPFPSHFGGVSVPGLSLLLTGGAALTMCPEYPGAGNLSWCP